MKKIAGMMLACLAGWGGVCAQPFQGEYGARFGLDGLDRG